MLRRLGTAGAACALAFGSAYLLQSGGLSPKPKVAIAAIADATIIPLTADVPGQQPETPMALRPLALPDLPQTSTILPQAGPQLPERVAALDPDWRMPGGASQARYDDFGQTCPATSLSLTPAGEGMMAVLYENPCDAGARLILEHESIMAAVTANAKGRATLAFPVLNPSGRVTVLSDTGEDLTLARPFDGGSSPRIVVSSDSAAALTLGSGSAIVIGDKAAPLAWTDVLHDGTQPILRAAVTAETCGQDLTARVTITGKPARTNEISLAMPDCTAIGQTVLFPLPAQAAKRYADKG